MSVDISDGPDYDCEHGMPIHEGKCEACKNWEGEEEDTSAEDKPIEAQVIDMVMTPAVRVELHKALDSVCNDLRDRGKLGSTTVFELVPIGGVRGQGDSLSVTLQVMLLPLWDGQPCGYFVPNAALGMTVH